MSEEYEIHATVPVHAKDGEIVDGKENTQKAGLESPKARNEKIGYIEIKAETTKTKGRKGTEKQGQGRQGEGR